MRDLLDRTGLGPRPLPTVRGQLHLSSTDLDSGELTGVGEDWAAVVRALPGGSRWQVAGGDELLDVIDAGEVGLWLVSPDEAGVVLRAVTATEVFDLLCLLPPSGHFEESRL